MLSEAIPQLNHSQQQQHTSRPGFFARLITKPSIQPINLQQQQQTIDQSIHWIILNNLNDWSTILEISDRLSYNPEDQTKTIKTIKNYYLKYSNNPQSLISSIRLIVILLLNSSDQFRLLVAKKLIKPIEDIFNKASKSIHGQPIRDVIIKAFAVLGFEFQHHESLRAFTRFYNKVRPADAPENGFPLAESGGLFAPVPNNQTPHRTQPHLPASPQPNGHNQHPMPLVRDVRAEAELARSHARLLLEALAFTSPSEMDSNQIIQEFHSNCLQSQNQLFDDIPWATEQAARARDNLSKHLQQQNQLQQAQLATNSDLRPVEPASQEGAQIESTREEQLLEVLLSANTELTAAFRQYDELERLAREEKEFKVVEERSKVETRLNRNSHGWLTPETTEHPQQSGSSNPSPRHSFSPDPAALPASSAEDLKFSSQGYTVPDQPCTQFANLQLSRESPDLQVLNDHYPHQQDPDARPSKVVTPVERSEKSLGKMRRISTVISHSSDPSGALGILQHQSHSLHRFESSNHSSSPNSSIHHLH